ncbi:Oidioi.mRNA.OKI2018_I69.chr2.g6299.t1.cds [Oikopleura dioica]|uniref:Oidioi.mRNA.OKI2018_I69.chr2.g6299.t1.cds n=1 Tax=Oikopleura dioica TaxID=34765 RepID=A0ABN7T3H2_OIKDI|nr:Oidioi.mRNA.OKI2018_I69.chr2.g6299.t1.cds [Oikopleura dioica]
MSEEAIWDDLASEIADDFAGEYLKNADNMSENELKKLREDLRKKIGKSSKKIVFNPVTKQYEKNISRGERNAHSDAESDEGEIKDEKITADDLINELINDETNENDLKLVTDVIMESSKNRKSTQNGDSHRLTPVRDEPMYHSRNRLDSVNSDLIREKTKSKWASDSSDDEADKPELAALPAAVTSLQQEMTARSLSQHSSPAHMATPPPPAQEDVLGGLYDENGEALENDQEPEGGRLDFYYPSIQGCRQVDDSYKFLNRIAEGTYGVVFRAVDKRSEQVVALKKLKMEKEKLGFPITSLREIVTLLKAKHENVINVLEICVGATKDKIYIAMEYLEHDMKTLMETMKGNFTIGEVKTLMIQLLRGVNHLHDNWILHRDLKTSNLLLNHKAVLKIADFGLAREYGSPLGEFTEVVVTLWYRSPELLLGQKKYSTYIDLWSCGCIMGEFLQGKPLFPGKTEQEQCKLIFKELGTPDDNVWPGFSELPHAKKINWERNRGNMLRKRYKDQMKKEGYNFLNGHNSNYRKSRTRSFVNL